MVLVVKITSHDICACSFENAYILRDLKHDIFCVFLAQKF